MKKTSGGYVAELLDKANEFSRIGFEQITFNKKLLGTKVLVTRTSSSSKYKQVYGSLYTSTLVDSENSSFSTVLLLNMNDMKKLYSRTLEQVDVYDNVQELEVGDIISYVRSGSTFKFKVYSIDTWADDLNVLYKYTLVGVSETVSDSESSTNCNEVSTEASTSSKVSPLSHKCK